MKSFQIPKVCGWQSPARSIVLLIFSLAITSVFQAQSFTWMKGSNATNQPGVYGTIGFASPSNIPGARVDAYTWTDASGNLWLYGGYGYDNFGLQGVLSDLWKYSISSNQWTWMKGDSMRNKTPVYGTQGVPANTNSPGGRYWGPSWKDASGNFWLFGGANMSDVWKYDPLINQWTWMCGSQVANQPPVYGTQGTPSPLNTPGTRYYATHGSDPSGNLWLFGGNGNLNSDLWKFTVSTGQWTWVNGTSSSNVNGVYGTLGVASSTVKPGGRMAGSLWADANSIWLFGGNGMDANNTSSASVYLNDVWKYNISSGQWMWVNGSSTGNQYATASAMETFSSTNTPGARVESLHFKDSQGKFWIFCGIGFTTGSSGYLNDLWKYDPVTNQWAWMQGSQLTLQNGLYGTQGVPSISNAPGSRIQTEGWIDNSNNIWLHGGYGMPQTGTWGYLNDLWKYSNCSSEAFSVSSSSSVSCAGSSVTITAAGGTSYTWSTNQSGPFINVSPNSTSLYNVTSSFTNGCVWTYPFTQSVSPSPILTVTPSSVFICKGNTSTLTASGANSYSWSTGQTGSVVTISPTLTSVYSVTAVNQYGCAGFTSVSQSVAPLPVVTATSNSTNLCVGATATLFASGAVTYSWSGAQTGSSLVVTPSVSVSYTVTGSDINNCKNSAVVNLSVSPFTTVTATSTNYTICSGESTTLTATGATSYTWNGVPGSSVVVVSPSAPASYTVTGSNNNNCNGSALLKISVNPTPQVTFFSSNPSICRGESVTITANGATTYTWSTNSQSNTIIVSPVNTVTYSVGGTDGKGCTGQASYIVMVNECTGIADKQRTESMHYFIFPNPVNEWFDVITDKPCELILRDCLSREVLKCKLEGSRRFEKSEFAAGVYYFSITSTIGQGTYTGKLIIN